jgi:hypothetical protein
MKKAAAVPVLKRIQKGEKCTIPISQAELFQLHDIADGLRLLRDIAQEAPELHLIQAEILIIKTSHCAWNLIHEELDSRWQESHPDVDLIRQY